MRIRTLFGLAAAVGLVLPGPGAAQEEALEEAQEEAQQWVFLYTDHVRPSMTAEYEEATRGLIELFNSADLEPGSVQWTTVSGPEIGYVYVIPTAGYADFEQVNARFRESIGKAGGEEWGRLAAMGDAASDHATTAFWRVRPDLSYKPEEMGFDPAKPYRHYVFWYGVQGQVETMEAVSKEIAELWASHEIERPWMIVQAVTGPELPLFVVVEAAADAAEFEAAGAETEAILGEEWGQLFMKAQAVARRWEIKSGWLRPDLSYPSLTPDDGDAGGE